MVKRILALQERQVGEGRLGSSGRIGVGITGLHYGR